MARNFMVHLVISQRMCSNMGVSKHQWHEYRPQRVRVLIMSTPPSFLETATLGSKTWFPYRGHLTDIRAATAACPNNECLCSMITPGMKPWYKLRRTRVTRAQSMPTCLTRCVLANTYPEAPTIDMNSIHFGPPTIPLRHTLGYQEAIWSRSSFVKSPILTQNHLCKTS